MAEDYKLGRLEFGENQGQRVDLSVFKLIDERNLEEWFWKVKLERKMQDNQKS